MNDTALLVLDMQNDIVHPNGVIGSTGFSKVVEDRALIPNIKRIINAFRAKKMPVVFVRVGFRSDYRDAMSKAPRVTWLKEQKGAVLGTWGTEFHEEIAPLPEEMVYTKNAVNPFFNTGLLLWLLRNNIRTLVLCGVHTHMVVDTTARNADDAGFLVKVLEDCCASPDPEIHDFEMRKILPLFGEVVTSEELLNRMG